MQMYLRELKTIRKSLLIWSFSLVAFLAMGLGKYVSLSSQAELFTEMVNSMPEALIQATGMKFLNLAVAIDFYAFMFNYVLLIASIFSLKLGATILSKEETDKTIEFLATKPIKRKTIVSIKLLVAFTQVLLFDCIVMGASFGLIELVRSEAYDINKLIIAAIFLLVFECIYVSLGVMISVLLKKSSKSTLIAISIALFGYFVTIFNEVAVDSWLKYLSPFEYFKPLQLFKVGVPDPIYIILSGVIIILSLFIAYTRYQKKEFLN